MPHPRTLSRWYKVINGTPEFTKEAFLTLKAKTEENSIVCNLPIDEMAIRKHVHWDGTKYTGFVDLGADVNTIPDDEEPPQANRKGKSTKNLLTLKT